jgi:hypothetical protein
MDQVLGSGREVKKEGRPAPKELTDNIKRNISQMIKKAKVKDKKGFRFNAEIHRFLFKRDPLYREVF